MSTSPAATPDAAVQALIAHGLLADEAHAKLPLFQSAANAIGSPRPEFLFVPGRVEFMGKHTDYAGGRSLLAALPRGLCLAVAPNPTAELHIIDAATREESTFPLNASATGKPGHFSTYAGAVARRIALNFPAAGTGAHIAFASDLPPAAGLSSSSALIVAFFLALARTNNLQSHPEYAANIRSTEDLAAYLGSIENGSPFRSLAGDRGVGTRGGSQDHTAILCSRPNALVQYRFNPATLERTIPFPGDHQLLIAGTGVIAEKSAGARDVYNRASRAVHTLLELWRTNTRRTDENLFTALLSDKTAETRLRNFIAHSPPLPDFTRSDLEDRLNQVLLESTVAVPAVGDAIAARRLADLGALVESSFIAARDLLKNQIPETEFLVHSARQLGALAASPFGAGWGGSVWSIINNHDAPAFLNRWRQIYLEKFPRHQPRAAFFPARPSIPATWL